MSVRVVISSFGGKVKVRGMGNFNLVFFSSEKVTPVHLSDLLLVPSCTENRFSLVA